MARHHKVHELLSREQLDELEGFAREPGRTVDECHEWLLAHGFTISRGAVGNWKQEFDLADRVRRAGEVSRAYLEAASGEDETRVMQASLRKFQELVFEHLLTADEKDAGGLMKIAVAMKTAVGAQQGVLELKQKMAAAVQEAEAKARAGASATDVVSVIKRSLGITVAGGAA